ncbi:unnamed protein product [Meloidogyne enterolobii]|uniref:Uncharacterized protein n=1 Tax=Meloidogyne enterolobii TaxID=390850 RepID=A0ACB1B5D8_MELEN
MSFSELDSDFVFLTRTGLDFSALIRSGTTPEIARRNRLGTLDYGKIRPDPFQHRSFTIYIFPSLIKNVGKIYFSQSVFIHFLFKNSFSPVIVYSCNFINFFSFYVWCLNLLKKCFFSFLNF